MSDTYYAGVDNGKQGGIVVIDDSNSVVHKEVMPVYGTGTPEYDWPAIVQLLERFKPALVTLEKVFVTPQISKRAVMSLAGCLGAFEGICASMRLPRFIASPKEWQRHLFKGMSYSNTKTASIAYAKKMQPGESWRKSDRATKDHDGLTDAFCLAIYGRAVNHGLAHTA